ncbi:hypothetical protein ABZT28_28575, partial [Streptomyces sp. NPDC005388]|uniref:hypothetical protein n=1 Tax=Streptomyces sp. NPDC005388 TaxID=3156717 RepID=UPI0033AB717E
LTTPDGPRPFSTDGGVQRVRVRGPGTRRAVLVVIVALLTAAGAGKLARLDGATYPAAVTRAAATFAAVLTVAAAVTAALAPFFS